MALTDPELDLLLEMLADDPADDAAATVAEEYLRRYRWAAARDILLAAAAAGATGPVWWPLRARAYLEAGDPAGALAALTEMGGPGGDARLARVEMLALERTGESALAVQAAERILAERGDDVVANEVLFRANDASPVPALRGADPFDTVFRADALLAAGQVDRALRLLRRLSRHHPDQPALIARIRAAERSTDAWPRDLSEDLTDPADLPPALAPLMPMLDLAMPGGGTVDPALPRHALRPDDMETDPGGPRRGHTPVSWPSRH